MELAWSGSATNKTTLPSFILGYVTAVYVYLVSLRTLLQWAVVKTWVKYTRAVAVAVAVGQWQ